MKTIEINIWWSVNCYVMKLSHCQVHQYFFSFFRVDISDKKSPNNDNSSACESYPSASHIRLFHVLSLTDYLQQNFQGIRNVQVSNIDKKNGISAISRLSSYIPPSFPNRRRYAAILFFAISLIDCEMRENLLKLLQKKRHQKHL